MMVSNEIKLFYMYHTYCYYFSLNPHILVSNLASLKPSCTHFLNPYRTNVENRVSS